MAFHVLKTRPGHAISAQTLDTAVLGRTHYVLLAITMGTVQSVLEMPRHKSMASANATMGIFIRMVCALKHGTL